MTSLILDTDIGGDPDDALTLVLLGSERPDLKLVITSDEVDGLRAGFAKQILKLIGREDVEVIAGSGYGSSRYLALPARPSKVDISSNVTGAVGKVLSEGHPVEWLGIGPLTNLRDAFEAFPFLRDQMRVVQMGGALRYRDPDRAEHNFRLDPEASRIVVESAKQLTLVTSDITFDPRIEVKRTSKLYRQIQKTESELGSLLRAHFDKWFAEFYPGSMKHDVLAASVLMGQSFVETEDLRIKLDEIGRVSVDEDGAKVSLSKSAKYAAFNSWSDKLLSEAILPLHRIELF